MPRTRLLSGLFWLALSALLWWLLAGGGWYIGLPAVLLATLLTQRLQLRYAFFRPARAPHFLLTFVSQLLAGGWDVARRTLTPTLPIDPVWVDYPLVSHDARVRMLLSALVGLLPGTLSTGVKGDHLVLHVLDRDLPWQSDVARLERALDRMIGERHQ